MFIILSIAHKEEGYSKGKTQISLINMHAY